MSSFALNESAQRFRFEEQVQALHYKGKRISEHTSCRILREIVLQQCQKLQSQQREKDVNEFNDFDCHKHLVQDMLEEVSNTQLRREAAIAILDELGA